MYRQLMDTLHWRFGQHEHGDATAVLHPQALVDATTLLRLTSEPPFDASKELRAAALATVLRLHWYRYLVLPEQVDEPDRQQSLWLFTQLLETDATRTPSDLAASMLQGLLQRLQGRGLSEDPQVLLSPIADLEVGALAAFLERGRFAADTEQAAAVQLLAQVRWLRYQALPSDSGWHELTAALQLFEAIYDPHSSVVPPLVREYLERLEPERRDHQSPAFASGWFGMALSTPEHLRLAGELVLRARRELAEVTDEVQRQAALSRLCSSLLLRYVAALHRRDLDEALDRGLALLAGSAALPPDVLAELAITVGRGLAVRADIDQRPQDQTQAIALLCDAAQRLGLHHPQIPDIAESLIATVSTQPDQVDAVDIDRIVALIDACAERDPQEQATWRLRRTLLQIIKHRHSRDDADLDEALRLGADLAVPGSPDDRYRQLVGSQLAHALHDRFRRTGRLADLNRAIAWMRRIVRRSGDAAAPWDQEVLGHWLYERHSWVGHPQDLKDAVVILSGLVRKHGGSANLEVLSNAIVTGLQAHVLTEKHQLEDAVRFLRSIDASSDATDPSARAVRLVNLAAALRALHHASGSPQALQEAVDAASAAVSLASVDDPHHVAVMEAYVRVLLDRRAPSDLDTAIQAATHAVRRATDATQRAELLSLAAAAYVHRCNTGNERPGDRQAAVAALHEAASLPGAQPEVRRRAAYLWAAEALRLGDFGSAAAGYAVAVDLVADLVWRATPLADRRKELATWAGAERRGAACAVRARQPELAVELLERGRGVLRSQILQRRTDLELVRSFRADLADRMEWIQRTIEGFDQRETAENFYEYLRGGAGMLALQLGDPDRGYSSFPEWMPLDYQGIQAVVGEILGEQQDHSQDLRLAAIAEWDSLADQLRQEPELAGLGRPPALHELQSAAAGGAVVMVNLSSIGSDALIVSSDAIDAIALPDLDEDAAQQALRKLLAAALALEGGDRSVAARRRSSYTMSEIQEWLWGSLAEPVLTALGHDGRPPPGAEWPRVWWCLTGPLAGLPVHAAGSRSGPDASVMDRVISSYTTTLSALLRARQTAPRDQRRGQSPRFAAVGMPLTPGAPRLHGIEREIGELRRQLQGPSLSLIGEQATVDAVARALEGHEWMHFACHGTPTLEGAPARLYLHDGPLSVHRIGWAALHHADLAYLSACHTADTSFSLPDEADHLAAAFQTAGYRHVVGTLWGAGDRISARVAASFYRHLAGPEGYSSDRAAQALHAAVIEVRASHDDMPFLWAPFVHFGP